ncbi:MAG TPA: hypothetical protein PLA74_02260 [Syntrophales bacterium]|nr:hypothetical protein [Syntrophales bacterium]HPQ43516.1 hypothetical protein [Syntrophales bacterium]
MLYNQVTGLEGMLNPTQWIFNNISGNAFSSAMVLAGFFDEDDLTVMETPEMATIGASELVAGLEGMLDATQEGIPNNGLGRELSISERFAGVLAEEELPEIMTLAVA